jgi:hypothetical protein
MNTSRDTLNTSGATTTSTRQGASHRRSVLAGCALAAGLGLTLPLATAGPASATAGSAPTPYALRLSSQTLAFGARDTGSASTKSVTLTNTGSRSLQPLQVLSGASSFTVSADGCSGRTVQPAGTCSFTVRFAPQVAGPAAGQLKVLTEEGTAAQNVVLSGTGVQQLMQSYFYQYTFTSPPVINGVAAPQSFIGSGFAPAGTYSPGQVVAVYDPTGLKQIGSYRIGTTTPVPLDAARLNRVTVSSYTWGSKTITAGTGLQSVDGTSGLSSEAGYLNGYGAEGSGAFFNDHSPAIRPSHW